MVSDAGLKQIRLIAPTTPMALPSALPSLLSWRTPPAWPRYSYGRGALPSALPLCPPLSSVLVHPPRMEKEGKETIEEINQREGGQPVPL